MLLLLNFTNSKTNTGRNTFVDTVTTVPRTRLQCHRPTGGPVDMTLAWRPQGPWFVPHPRERVGQSGNPCWGPTEAIT